MHLSQRSIADVSPVRTSRTLDLLVDREPQIRRVYAILHDQSHVYEKMGALGVVAMIEAEERLRARFRNINAVNPRHCQRSFVEPARGALPASFLETCRALSFLKQTRWCRGWRVHVFSDLAEDRAVDVGRRRISWSIWRFFARGGGNSRYERSRTHAVRNDVHALRPCLGNEIRNSMKYFAIRPRCPCHRVPVRSHEGQLNR